MSSEENALVNEQGLNEEKVEEVTPQSVEETVEESIPQVETEEAESPAEAEEEQPKKVYETKAEILERVREIAHGDESPKKEEIDFLKTAFYKLHIAEREAKLKAYIDGGGDPEQYQITPDETEEAFKAEMGIIKEKRAKIF